MEIYEASLSGIPLLRVVGDIDHYASAVFDEAVRKILARDGSRLLLDLSACTYIDSGGLGVILIALEEVRERGWLGVVDPDPNVHRLHEMVGLLREECFLVFGDEEEAAAFISAQGPGNSSCSSR
jgi:anti-anti-sigma factor